MITLIASIAGFITPIIPEVIKFHRDKQDKVHELEIMDRQIKFQEKNQNQELEEIILTSNLLERATLYSTYNTGIGWVDAFNGTVRPLLAYSFFVMYVGIKIMQYIYISNHGNIIDHINIIWNIDDQAIFAGIVSFYFGQRGFKKNRRYEK
jgi:hypothetical protein